MDSHAKSNLASVGSRVAPNPLSGGFIIKAFNTYFQVSRGHHQLEKSIRLWKKKGLKGTSATGRRKYFGDGTGSLLP